MLQKYKFFILFLLSLLASGTIGAGIYFKHYFVVFVFVVWLFIEFVANRLRGSIYASSTKIRSELTQLLSWYDSSDQSAFRLLDEKLKLLKLDPTYSKYEQRWNERLRALSELKALLNGISGRKIKEAFIFRIDTPLTSSNKLSHQPTLEIQDITEAAMVVSDLYWKLYETACSNLKGLNSRAQMLYEALFQETFDDESSRKTIEQLTDAMQRDGGITFLILNYFRQGDTENGQKLARALLHEFEPIEIDDDTRSALYWMSEISWFTRENKTLLTDYESSVRYLYHLCFTNPSRGGFLEIDSQFFSQFEMINEIAREGFLFKETLIEKILMLWRDQYHFFDPVFKNVLETLCQTKNKIFDCYETWFRFWNREKESFSRDYLYIVEGNLCFATAEYEEALHYYSKALIESPKLRPALFNSLFCYAKLKRKSEHEDLIQRILRDKSLLPSALYAIGDSYLLIGDEEASLPYYSELRKFDGWDKKVEFYKSTFCFEHGLYEKALEYAEKAKTENPSDKAVHYHLSLCYNIMGKKDRALDMVKEVGEAPQWLDFYRFTLERDIGDLQKASETLLRIPTEYFDDPEEFKAAVDFAKSREDLVLLRHLRKKD